MEYSDCASGCPATCVNPDAPDDCRFPCVSGCRCLTGLLASGNTCVPREECGCVRDGKYYMVRACSIYLIYLFIFKIFLTPQRYIHAPIVANHVEMKFESILTAI